MPFKTVTAKAITALLVKDVTNMLNVCHDCEAWMFSVALTHWSKGLHVFYDYIPVLLDLISAFFSNFLEPYINT